MEVKIVFYKTLLQRGKNISFNERILYSFLVSKTISGLGVISSSNEDDEKKLNLDELYSILNENNNWVECQTFTKAKLSKLLGFSRQSIITNIQNLIEAKYLKVVNDKLYIYASKQLIEHGYFEIKRKDGLNGELLIFYSYLCDKANQQAAISIDTQKRQMALDFGNKDGYVFITKLINRLSRLRLVERLENHRLKIYK